MWTRTYLLLVLVRCYLAISPSYIHPDENFQGPEVIAGWIFDLPNRWTWEFTSADPVRSIFPLWPVYALPMTVLKWIWAGIGTEDVPPEITYYALRILMCILSIVLEDWAIHELVPTRRHQRRAVILVASSYVTWTYQTHTFSNSMETLAVLWTLVMIQRILDNRQRSSLLSTAILGLILTFGVFNRITFPAYTLIPCCYLLPHFLKRPSSFLTLFATITLAVSLAIVADTLFYHPDYSFKAILSSPTITPLNSLLYNSSATNLAQHGLHPYYQHILVNLPQLLGPALLLVPTKIENPASSLPVISALSGLLILSGMPHQEARFLLSIVPLLLSSLRVRIFRTQTVIWIIFNAVFGALLGVYHQGGVMPAQIQLGKLSSTESLAGVKEVFWWRTYPPPIYLLGKNTGINTTDCMGMPFGELEARLQQALTAGCVAGRTRSVGLVAPWSSVEVDGFQGAREGNNMEVKELWRWSRHLNLDDLDIGSEGIWGTLGRVVGRRGLVIWRVEKTCADSGADVLGGDW